MTVTDILAIIGAVVAGLVTIASALGALVVTLRSEAARKIDADSKDDQLGAIHEQVNSKMSKAVEVIAGLSAQVADLTGTPGDVALAGKAARGADRSVDLEVATIKARLDAALAEVKRLRGDVR